MEPPAKNLSLTYSLADQCFAHTKSIGILNVSVELLAALARRMDRRHLTVLVNRTLQERLILPDGVDVKEHDYANGGGLGRVYWDQLGVYAAAQRTGNDWLFLPKGFASFSRRPPMRLATFVHDVMQDHYDQIHPTAVSGLEAGYFRAGFHASVRESEVIFTPTEFTLREIKRVADEKGWPVPRLVCCGEGFAPATTPAMERRDLIVLTSRFPHKLTKVAVEFMTRWSEQHSFAEEIHWIGSLPKGFELPDRPNWRRHSILAEEKFRALMGRARAVLSFSDYEGFGRPPVEAVLAGACPVFSSIPTTREVMGDCGCPFDNTDYASFSSALQQALTIDQDRLQIWAKALSARHDWGVVADRVLAALATAKPVPHS